MWGKIKARFSRLTIGFAAVGLGLGLLMAMVSIVYANAADALQESISRNFVLMLALCPPSLGVMALDGPEPWYALVFAYTFMALENMILYGVVGAICNQMWKLVRHAPTSPRT